jgi:hypothetical protein
MPPWHLGSGARSITTSLIWPISTTQASSSPSIHGHDVASSQQIRRHGLSLAAQQQHQSDIQRARSESLATLTAAHPRSYRRRRAAPLSLNEPHQVSAFSSQDHLTSLRNCSHSNRHLRPPSQYNPLLSSTLNETAPQHRILPLPKYREVPRRESLAQ